ncbi:unnamed protein product [Acanthoscelides obtectus]|uniref:Uncharacterized protein n=1 Tax=Acanthoscelides obtectus TaxID=200917 RepID=A0A9P0Q149_ACAOB|nr:unnamed protein product [Acanthoscelides obtectus]CAK1622446.1 hypothetical protein AOBTE_LOCUS1490 [Acanthoscelides obtectus]
MIYINQPIWFAYETMDEFLGGTLKSKNNVDTERGLEETQGANSEPTEEILEETNENQSQSMDTQRDGNQTIRRRQNPSELIHAGNIVKDALATFKSALNRNESSTHLSDDCDLYGKLLANKLRKLSEITRLKFMRDIDGMYLRYQLEETPSLQTPSPTYPSIAHNFNESRPGTSSSTYSEPTNRYEQVTQQTYCQNRKAVSAPPPKIMIQSNQVIRTPDVEYPVLHIPNQVTDNSESNQAINIIQTAFDLT